ncbi:MAG TPA: DUF305 domain-containing protein [Rhodothermia bacterium]|nr:DUF305 domain-containing protein [Rhodothermia bacterium]
MKIWSRSAVAGFAIGLTVAGCSTATRQTPAGAEPRSPAEQARADSGRAAYTPSDVRFMQGMIRHHAQAIVMAGWAPAHAAREDVKILAGRIAVSQRDEIAFMERWLRERHETVPESTAQHDTAGHQMSTSGSSMPELMPGMLTPAQLAKLSSATGSEFDRLFLTFMIQHHQGALTMVEQLFSSQGAGQEPYVFRFASDVEIDQNTEIERMRSMLRAAPRSGQNP